MEVALVECIEESHFALELPSNLQKVVLCIQRGKLGAPAGCPQLRSLDPSTGLQERSFVFFDGDFELGFILGRFSTYRVTFYTSRNDMDSFQTIKVKTLPLPVQRAEPTTSGPRPQEACRSDAGDQFLKQLEEKYRTAFLINPMTRATKKSSVLAQMRNIADGICTSFKLKYPHLAGDMPGSEELAERLYEDLKRRGLISERLGNVEYFVQGAPQPVRVPVSLPSSKKLVTTMKLDTLHKYIEKFLMQTGVRAIKEKSARAQLANLAKGAVSATKTKYGANVDIPTEEKMSADMFEKLIEIGVVSVDGLNVVYCDDRVAEVAGDVLLQEQICEESDQRERARVQSDIKTTILKEALSKYYQKFLTNVLSAAKTTKGVKEQIKNFVQGSVSSALKSNPDAYRSLSSLEDMTEIVYRMMITRKVITTVGSGIKYNAEAIEQLEREMAEIGWEEEVASPEVGSSAVQQIVQKVAQQCMEQKKLTLKNLYELAKRNTHASLVFERAFSSESMPAIAKEVVHTLLSSGDQVRLDSSSPSLEEVMEDLDNTEDVYLVISGADDSEEEGA